MLRKLENQPHLTHSEMLKRFSDKWFRYVEYTDGTFRVLYTADTKDELYSVTAQKMKEDGYKHWGNLCPEHLLLKDLQIGGLDDVIPWPRNSHG